MSIVDLCIQRWVRKKCHKIYVHVYVHLCHNVYVHKHKIYEHPNQLKKLSVI